MASMATMQDCCSRAAALLDQVIALDKSEPAKGEDAADRKEMALIKRARAALDPAMKDMPMKGSRMSMSGMGGMGGGPSEMSEGE